MNELKIVFDYYKDNNKGLMSKLRHNKDLQNNLINATSFLPLDTVISERVLYYKNNWTELQLCPYCNKQKRRFKKLDKGLFPTCGSEICKRTGMSIGAKSSGKDWKAIHEKKRKTYKERTGYDHNMRNPECIEKRKERRNFTLKYSKEDLQWEFDYYKKYPGTLDKQPKYNKIVKQFQQNEFFKYEKALLKNKNIYNKLLINRKKYLSKDNISFEEMLRGCKISGLYYGYSHFNPLWTKWFVEKYNVKSIFDPCGGWGHHFLGVHNILEKYIYNDLSFHTKENVDKIIKYFNIKNIITYNQPGENIIINDIDAYFTCPPYVNLKGDNLEHYECGDFPDIISYKNFLNRLISNWKCSNSRIYGMILREDMINFIDLPYTESFEITGLSKVHSHLSKNKKRKEYLYIWIN